MKNFLINLMTFRKKLATLSKKKKINKELTYNKKFLKSEKEHEHKRRLSLYLETSNIDWFSLQKKLIILP